MQLVTKWGITLVLVLTAMSITAAEEAPKAAERAAKGAEKAKQIQKYDTDGDPKLEAVNNLLSRQRNRKNNVRE